mgnify:FL=1
MRWPASIGYSAESLGPLIELVYEAHRIGVVNQVLQANMLEAFVNSYSETMAGNAPLSIVASKRVIDEYLKDPKKRNQKVADDAVVARRISVPVPCIFALRARETGHGMSFDVDAPSPAVQAGTEKEAGRPGPSSEAGPALPAPVGAASTEPTKPTGGKPQLRRIK